MDASPADPAPAARPWSAAAVNAPCQSQASPGAARPATSGTTTAATVEAAYEQEHYAAHRELYIAKAGCRKQTIAMERAAYLFEFFRERPCVDCGEADPLVLEFDHLEAKDFNIAMGLRDRRWQAVLDEIAKCEVVCANCHRRRTALRAGFARAVVAQR